MPEHVPVLVDEVRTLLQPERGGIFVDGTVGLAGHSRMLLEAGAERLVGIDRDTDALAIARDTSAPPIARANAAARALRLGLLPVDQTLAAYGPPPAESPADFSRKTEAELAALANGSPDPGVREKAISALLGRARSGPELARPLVLRGSRDSAWDFGVAAGGTSLVALVGVAGTAVTRNW